MANFVKIETKRVEVTVPRTCQCISDADVYTVDTFHVDDLRPHKLLWDVSNDTFAIGYFCYKNEPCDTYYGYNEMAFQYVRVYDDRRKAMRDWIKLTKED